MLLTIDTNNITQLDLAALKFLLSNADPSIDIDDVVPARVAEKPAARRPRRTKAQIEADEAAAAAKAAESQVVQEEVETAPGAPAENHADEVGPDIRKAEAEVSGDVTPAQVVELATKLMDKDKALLRELLNTFEVRKVSDLPEDKLADFADAIRAKLA